MCAARTCELAVVYLDQEERTCFESIDSSSLISLFLQNYQISVHALRYKDEEEELIMKQILTMNGVLFMIRNTDQLSKLQTLITNPVIVYNNLLSVNLCYDATTIPKSVQIFAHQHEILLHKYCEDKETEMAIISKVLEECHAMFMIQRELCLKKIETNELHAKYQYIGINLNASDYVVSCVLLLFAVMGSIAIIRFS